MKRLAKKLAHRLGVDLRRAVDPALPLLRTITCDGEAFRFWIANPHTRAWWDKSVLPLNAELRGLKQLCRPGSIVLEVGAHHGMDTVLLARWTGASGHVYALEANAGNTLVLDANLGANKLVNCTGLHTAVGAANGWIRVADETVDEGDPLARRVPIIALDEFCRERNLRRVDLLKIDVEGYEAHVLQGATRVLEARPAIALELHLDLLARYGSSAVDVLQQIGLSAYDVTMMVRPDWETLRTFEGVASLPAGGTVNLFFRPR
jgi:FkbM family methyltransferase